MEKLRTTRWKASFALVGFFLILNINACWAVQIGDIVADFDSGVQQSSTAVRKFYMDLNDFERKLYFDKLLFDRKQGMGFKQHGESTGMLRRFDDDDIQARVLAINTISSYSRGLVQLASPERAKRTEKSITSIGTTIGRINSELSALPSAATSIAVSKYAGPIGALAGLAAKYWMGFQRDKALKATISEGAPQVEQLFDLLEGDLKEVMDGTYKNGSQTNLQEYISYYNNNLAGAENDPQIDATRICFLRSAQESADRYAHIDSANPSALVKKMRKVHRDLVAWAQQKNAKPENIDGLLDDLQSYLTEVDKVTDALSAIRKAAP
jgi:hypothetical protein